MKFYLKQKSLLKNNFEITDVNEQIVYRTDANIGGLVGLRSKILDANTSEELAFVKQRFGRYVYDIYQNEVVVATIKKRWFSAKGRYIIEGLNWEMKGTKLLSHSYILTDNNGIDIAEFNKKRLAINDSFELDIHDESQNISLVLAVIIAFDSIIDQLS